jgi:hypothetical protein
VSGAISTVTASTGLSSDQVLSHLAPGLERLGFTVESSRRAHDKIFRPVFFGESGHAEISYEIDGWHNELGIVVEVEASRGAEGNATFRDLVRTSLIVDAAYLALLLPVAYRRQSRGREVTARAYDDCVQLLNAVFFSQRLRLPFEGILIVGY